MLSNDCGDNNVLTIKTVQIAPFRVLMAALKDILLENNIIFKNQGVELSPIDDTMLLSYTLDAGNNRHNMDTLSEIHLSHKTISYKDLVGTGKKQLNFSEVDLKSATEYAAEDADVTLRLYEILSERVSEEKLEKIYEVFEKPMIKILSKLETNGIKVDDTYLKKLSKVIPFTKILFLFKFLIKLIFDKFFDKLAS